MILLALVALTAATPTAPVTATPVTAHASPDAAPISPEPAPARSAGARFATPALDDADLGAQAGRADLSQEARNSQTAGVSGSSVNGTSRTGAVTIDGNAFQNMSGLTVVNANSGNNVAMNGAMTVNVAISPNP